MDFIATETGQYQIRIYRQPEGDYNEQSNSIGIAWVKLDPFRIFLSGVMNNFTTELIRNGNFDASGAYWSTTTSQSSCTSPAMFGVISDTTNLANTIAADLGRCNYNTDTISQIVTIPSDVVSATLTYKYRVEQTYTQPFYYDFLYIKIHDYQTGQEVDLLPYPHDDRPPRGVWITTDKFDLSSWRGRSIGIIFKAFNSDAVYPSNFWVDDVSLSIIR